jgi:hypothetical protein
LTDRVVFFVGYGCIGILPLLQLKILWRFAAASTIGHILFVATFSVVISSFCDANLSYRAVNATTDAEVSHDLLEVYKIRFARLILLAPIAMLLFASRGASLMSIAGIGFLSATYLLNYAFIYRNSGSVTSALAGDFLLRALCQLLPVFGALGIGGPAGLLVGCICAFVAQIIIVGMKFDIRIRHALPNFRGAISRDLFSGVLALVYSSFCQTVSAFELSSDEFARFISIDRLVRAGLLITEPCRLWFLRRSWLQSSEFALGRIFAASAAAAAASLAAVAILFASGLAHFIVHVELANPFYIGVSFFVSFVSFFSLCAFVRYSFVATVNWVLLVAVLTGAAAYRTLLGSGPFVASFTFEALACLIVGAGSILTRYARFRDS